MCYLYKLVKERLFNEDIGEYETYGIEVTDESGSRVDYQTDVTVDKESAEKFVELINKTALRPCMFHKAVEDIFYT